MSSIDNTLSSVRDLHLNALQNDYLQMRGAAKGLPSNTCCTERGKIDEMSDNRAVGCENRSHYYIMLKSKLIYSNEDQSEKLRVSYTCNSPLGLLGEGPKSGRTARAQ